MARGLLPFAKKRFAAPLVAVIVSGSLLFFVGYQISGPYEITFAPTPSLTPVANHDPGFFGDAIDEPPSNSIITHTQEDSASFFVDGRDRRHSFPFITGDGFRSLCDKRCERATDRSSSCNFVPADVKAGDCIFIATTDLTTFRTTTQYLQAFGSLRGELSSPYIVITHNGDLSVPEGDDWHPHEPNPQEWKESFSAWLDDPLLYRWFASNCNWKGKQKPVKLSCIPIGLENRYIGKSLTFGENFNFSHREERRLHVNHAHQVTVLVDFDSDDIKKPDRRAALEGLGGKPFVHRIERLSYSQWQSTVKSHQFVVCPQGHGLDTHRTWEVLLLGSYPITISSTLNELFDDLPVFVVNSWSEVTEYRLQQWLSRSQPNNLDRAWMPYWIKKVFEAQEKAIQARFPL